MDDDPLVAARKANDRAAKLHAEWKDALAERNRLIHKARDTHSRQAIAATLGISYGLVRNVLDRPG